MYYGWLFLLSLYLFLDVVFCQRKLPSLITLHGVMRDMSVYHRDFQNRQVTDPCYKHMEGLVEQELFKGLPVFTPPNIRTPNSLNITGECAQNQTSYSLNSKGKALFDENYRDVPGHNVAYDFSINLHYDSIKQFYTFAYYFYPLDQLGFSREQCWSNSNDCILSATGVNHNFLFTTEIKSLFYYSGGEMFTVAANGDMRVFVNNQKLCDMGNTNIPEKCQIQIDSLGLPVNSTFEVAIFHAQRHPPGDYYYLITTALPVNNIPKTFSFSTATNENTPMNITLKGFSSDVGRVLTFYVIEPLPFKGVVYCAGSTPNYYSSLSPFECQSGIITYQPFSGIVGHDTLNFAVSDHISNSTSAVVDITIVPIPEPMINSFISLWQPQLTTMIYFLDIYGIDVSLPNLTLNITSDLQFGIAEFGFNSSIGQYYLLYQAFTPGLDLIQYIIQNTTDNYVLGTGTIYMDVEPSNYTYPYYDEATLSAETNNYYSTVLATFSVVLLAVAAIVVFIYFTCAKTKNEEKWNEKFANSGISNPLVSDALDHGRPSSQGSEEEMLSSIFTTK